MTSPERIARVSRAFSVLSLLGCAMLIGLGVWLSLSRSGLETAAADRLGGVAVGGQVTWFEHLLLVPIIFLALTPSVLAAWTLHRLFARFAEGDVLKVATTRLLRQLGLALLAGAAMSVLAPTLAILVLSWDNPPGQRILAISLSSATYAVALFGGLMLTLGWVMGEAVSAAEENRQFV